MRNALFSDRNELGFCNGVPVEEVDREVCYLGVGIDGRVF